MELQNTLTAGKYEALTHYIDDAEKAKAYLDACITETMHSGFDRQTAERIERDNITQYAKRYDPLTQRRINALFGRAR